MRGLELTLQLSPTARLRPPDTRRKKRTDIPMKDRAQISIDGLYRKRLKSDSRTPTDILTTLRASRKQSGLSKWGRPDKKRVNLVNLDSPSIPGNLLA